MMNLYKANTTMDVICVDYDGNKTKYCFAYDILEYNDPEDFKKAVINVIGRYNYEYYNSIIATSHVKIAGQIYDTTDIIK